jgi:hypothetical protein
MPMRRSVPLARLTSMLLGKSSRASIFDARETEARTGPLKDELRAMSGSSTPTPGSDGHDVAAARPRSREVKGEPYAPLHHPRRLAGPFADLYRNRGAA